MKKQIKNLTVKKEDNNLIWAGAQDLMKRSDLGLDQYKKNSIKLVADALKITPFGVNLLGGLPYINNLGLRQKSQDYHKGSSFEYQWIKRSESDSDKAICEARIVQGNKPLTQWIVGEASPATIKMKTLIGYQNHLAQTRAENRCIRNLDGVRIHTDLLKEIAKLRDVDPEVASQAAQATSISAEEMVSEKISSPIIHGVSVARTEKSNPVELAKNFILAAKSKESLVMAESRIKVNADFSEENKKYLLALIKGRMVKLK